MTLKQRPSARLHRRYLLVEGASKEDVEKAILEYIGTLGWARAAPTFVSSEAGLVLAVERCEVDNVKAALALSPFGIRVVKVSGTLEGLGK